MRTESSLPRICVATTGSTPAELAECAGGALRDSRFVELRLDWVRRPEQALALIPKLATVKAPGGKPILQATCRRKPNGGRFQGSVGRQFEILEKALQAGCGVVDLEVESAESAGYEAVAALRQSARLILSFHDFDRTPSLAAAARRLRKFPADYYKIVPTATKQSDNCAVLEFLSGARSTTEKWLGFAMGEAGIPSRVLALSRGSAFIYAAPGGSGACGEAAAPGQLDWSMLQERYHVERLNGRTAIYGLLGNPVRHSIGAALHNAAFQAMGHDAVYLPLQSEDVGDFFRAAVRYPLSGFSVTIPHKQAVLRYIGKCDEWVRASGAANTVRRRFGRWEAINTDVEGIRGPVRKTFRLAELEKLPRDFRAVIVGNGGSARAAFMALESMGCRRIFLSGRNGAKVRRFVEELGGMAIPLDALREEKFDLLIHATPVGMWPDAGESLLSASQLNAKVVFDLVYNPPETRLLKLARARGCRTISGLEMFLTQAALQLEYWTGRQPPAATIRKVALRELDRLRGTHRLQSKASE